MYNYSNYTSHMFLYLIKNNLFVYAGFIVILNIWKIIRNFLENVFFMQGFQLKIELG